MMAIPMDLLLPLPAPMEVLKALLVITFIVHILFVGLMIGGAYWSVIFRVLARVPGREDPYYERLARETLSTVTVNKSLAVVLGVAPLLLIGLAYTRYWYTANMITVSAFLSIVWLVIVAFLLLYVYKYKWDALQDKWQVHIGIGAAACAIFSVVPLIFLTNINLMLLPYRWEATRGFADALLYANVIPRYLHFMVASFAMIGFFAAAYFWYVGRGSDDPFYPRSQKLGLKWALAATLLQGIFGPVLFITLPGGSYSTLLLILIGFSLVLVAAVCMLLIRALQNTTGASIIGAAALLFVIALLMSVQRHVVRENLLREPHQVAERRTHEYRASLAAFLETYTPEGKVAASGEDLFKRYCASCHARNKRLVGPPLTQMVGKYTGRKQQMIAYVLNPVKVDPDYPSMPKPAASEQEIETIVEYILTREPKAKEEVKAVETTPEPEKAEKVETAPGPEKAKKADVTPEPVEAKTVEATPEAEAMFEDYCSVCHAWERRLVGPPVTYMIEKYTGKKQQMIEYVLNPVKVNPDYPSMPESDASEQEVETIAEYILRGNP